MTKLLHTKRTPHTSHNITHAISLFFAVRGIMRTRIASGKKVDPLTWLRIETMKFISDHREPMMKEIADHLSITAPSATSLIRGLMKSGLVAHAVDRRDKRTARLRLTAKGVIELKESVARGTKLLKGLFTVLSRQELAAFITALERIKEKADE